MNRNCLNCKHYEELKVRWDSVLRTVNEETGEIKLESLPEGDTVAMCELGYWQALGTLDIRPVRFGHGQAELNFHRTEAADCADFELVRDVISMCTLCELPGEHFRGRLLCWRHTRAWDELAREIRAQKAHISETDMLNQLFWSEKVQGRGEILAEPGQNEAFSASGGPDTK